MSLSHVVWTVDTADRTGQESQPASPLLPQEDWPICPICIGVSHLSYLRCSVYISFANLILHLCLAMLLLLSCCFVFVCLFFFCPTGRGFEL